MRTNTFLKSILATLLLLGIFPFCYSQIPNDFTYWKFSSGAYNNGPLIRDSILFCGSMDKNFYAINTKTGIELWRFKTDYPITSSAALENDIICFESGNKLFGLNAKTGDLLWNYITSSKTPALGQATDFHHSSPLINNNIAYFGDEWGYLNGVNIVTGKLEFQYKISKSYTKSSNFNIRTKPAILDNVIYFGDYGANVYAISLKDSSEKWIHKLTCSAGWDGSLVSEVVIRDSSVYIGGYNNQFRPLDIKTGEERWTFTDYTFLPSTPVFYENYLILGTTIFSNKIHCIGLNDGKAFWSAKVKGIFFTKPVIINDSILVINSTDPFVDNIGLLYFINCKNGKILNQIFLPNATESYPVVVGDTLFLGRNDGMYAINYKPYLTTNYSADIEFNDSTENIVIDKSQSLNQTYPILNKSNFCDSISVTYLVEGDDSKSNIHFTTLNKTLIKPLQKLNLNIRATSNNLVPGLYDVKLKVYSYHNTEALFEKKISVLVTDNPSAIDETKDPNFNVYPNPFVSKVIFSSNKFSTSKKDLSIYSLQGILLYFKQFEKNETVEWDARNSKGDDLQNGIYVYSIVSDKCILKGKLVKQ